MSIITLIFSLMFGFIGAILFWLPITFIIGNAGIAFILGWIFSTIVGYQIFENDYKNKWEK